jgi:hypothetical protein
MILWAFLFLLNLQPTFYGSIERLSQFRWCRLFQNSPTTVLQRYETLGSGTQWSAAGSERAA